MADGTRKPRPYNSPLRQEQAAQTRSRILDAAVEIVHGFPIWNWDAVTHRAVAERSGVSLRTVYRNFATERELRDAVLDALAADAKIDFEDLQLEDLRDAVGRIIDSIASFPRPPGTPLEPTIEAVREKQRNAYVGAVSRAAGDWTAEEQRLAAAMIYVLSTHPAYTALVDEWGFDPADAAGGITWVISLIEEALRRGESPGS